MSQVGFINVPIAPGFEGVARALKQGLEEPAKASGKRASEAIKKTNDEMVKSLESQVKASSVKVQKLNKQHEDALAKRKEKQDKLTAAIANQTAAEEKYQEALKQGKSGTSELAKLEAAKANVTTKTNDLTKATRELGEVEEKQKLQTKDLAETTAKLEEAKLKAASGAREWQLSAEDAERATRDLENAQKLLLGTAAAVAGAVVAGGGALFALGDEYHKVGASIQIATGASGDALAGLEDSARSLAENVPVDFQTAADAIGTLNTYTGASGESLDRLSQQVLQASHMLGEDGVANAQAFGQALNQWSMDADEGAETMDGLFRITQDYGIGMQPLIGGLNQYSAALQNAGYSMEDAAILMGSLDKAGVPAAQAMGGLSKAFANWTKKGKDAKAELGDLVERLKNAEEGSEEFAEATEIFGARSAPTLINAIKNGSFALEDFDSALGDTSGLIAKTAEETQSFGDVFQKIRSRLKNALQPIATEIYDSVIPAMDDLATVAEGALAWIVENKELIVVTAKFLGGFAAGLYAVRGAMVAVEVAARAKNVALLLANGGFKTLDKTMKRSYIGILAGVVIGVATALHHFFTQTETGKQLWENFTKALADGWEWFTGALSDGWNWINDNVFTPFMEWVDGIGDDWDEFTATLGAAWDWITSALVDGWNTVKDAVFAAWEWYVGQIQSNWETFTNAISSAWDWVTGALVDGWNWVKDGVFNAWNTAVDAVKLAWDVATNAIVTAWQWVGDRLAAIFGVLRDAVFTAFEYAVGKLQAVWEGVTGALVTAWQWVSDRLLAIWEWIREQVFQAFENVLNGLQTIFDAVTNAISTAWSWLGDRLGAVWNWIDEHVFGKFRSGLDFLQSAFQTTVDAITRIWDGIKRAAAVPVKFVVDTVLNNGILKAFNTVAGWVGLDTKAKIPLGELGNYHTGGVLPGYTPGYDPYEFVDLRTGMRVGLGGGEAILRPEATRQLSPHWVDGINAAAKQGGTAGVAKWLDDYDSKRLGFANGGVIGSITNIVGKHFPMMSITSTYRPGDPGHHGAGRAVDFSNGFDTTPQMQAAAKFFHDNYGPGLLELIHSPTPWNIKNGKNVGDGFSFYGAGTMNGHRNHVHIAAPGPLGDPGTAVEQIWDGFVGFVQSLRERVVDKFSSVMDKAIGVIPEFPGEIGKWPKAMASHWKDQLIEFLAGRADEYTPAGGSTGNAESWRPLAKQMMRRYGFNADDPRQVDAMIAQIQSESGGDPGIAQQIVDINGTGESAGVGLLQIIPGTFAAHRDPALPNDRRDPEANMAAALRYYRGRYGNDLTTMWGKGHGYADGGIIDLSKLGIYDTGGVLEHGDTALNLSGKPEVVINNDQLRAINKLANNVGALVRKLPKDGNVAGFQAALHNEFSEFIKPIQRDLARMADKDSIPGITARQTMRRVLDLGIDLPGSEIISGILDAEESLWASRDRAAGHVANVREKEEALAAARAKAAEAHEVEVAEGENAEEKRAEAVKAANAEIAEAEKALSEARRKQAMDLDNITVVSQDMLSGLAGQARGLANQLVAMGAPAAAVGAGLAQVTGGLSSFAALIGPMGITLGMALDAVKIVVSLVKTIVGFVKGLIERIRQARAAAREAFAAGMQRIADYYKLLTEMGHEYAELQQQMIRNYMSLREAEFALRVAQNDRMIAAVESELKVAEARLALDREIERGVRTSQLHLQGLHEDWDSYMTHQARVSQDALGRWSDAAIGALFTYEKARAQAVHSELSARREQIVAEAKLAELTRQNARNQFDLIQLQERAARMMAQATGNGLPGATAQAQASKLLVEMAELQRKMDKNIFGRWGYKLGARGSFGNEYRGQMAQMESLRHALTEVLKETGGALQGADFDRALKQMSQTVFRGGDPAAVLRAFFPELAAADKTLRTNEALRPVYDAQDAQKRMERQIEDLKHETDLFGKTQPLEEALKGLDYTIKSLEHSAKAFESDNAGVRGEYLDAARAAHEAAKKFGVEWQNDRRYWSDQVKNQVKKEVTIHMEGDRMYTADEVDRLIREVTDGSNVSVTVRSSHVAAARRAGV